MVTHAGELHVFRGQKATSTKLWDVGPNRPPNFWTSYMCVLSMRNGNQILHDDQIGYEANFYRVDHPLPWPKFLVTFW